MRRNRRKSELELSEPETEIPRLTVLPGEIKQLTLARFMEVKSRIVRSLPGQRKDVYQIELTALRRQIRRALEKGAKVEGGPFHAWLETYTRDGSKHTFTRLRVE